MKKIHYKNKINTKIMSSNIECLMPIKSFNFRPFTKYIINKSPNFNFIFNKCFFHKCYYYTSFRSIKYSNFRCISKISYFDLIFNIITVFKFWDCQIIKIPINMWLILIPINSNFCRCWKATKIIVFIIKSFILFI